MTCAGAPIDLAKGAGVATVTGAATSLAVDTPVAVYRSATIGTLIGESLLDVPAGENAAADPTIDTIANKNFILNFLGAQERAKYNEIVFGIRFLSSLRSL